jgi:hypothetical protein
MENEPEKDVKEVVPTEPKETTPDPEVTPPAVTEKPDDDVKSLVHSLAEKVEELSATVASLAPVTPQDTGPVRKPWTHYGSR